jgi:hypothetical protein
VVNIGKKKRQLAFLTYWRKLDGGGSLVTANQNLNP